MAPFRFDLLDRVFDLVTMFSGEITARTDRAFGEELYLVESMDESGAPVSMLLPAGRLEHTLRDKIK